MKRRIKVLAILALIAASGVASQAVLANCVSEGPYEILQCGNSTWFAAPPAGSGHVTGWWWGVGFGNNNVVNNGVLVAPGGSAFVNPGTGVNGSFIGVDSGSLPALAADAEVALDLVDATTIAGIGAPAGSLCFSSKANWGSPGIDSCIDINRTDTITGGLTDAPGQSDNFANRYWDSAPAPNPPGPTDYEYFNHQLDPPMAVLLTEGTGTWFAAAFFATKPKTAPRQSNFDPGTYGMGTITNGGLDHVGGNSVVPWQAIPQPVHSVVLSDPNDRLSPRNVTMDWTATAPTLISDSSTRPCWSDSPTNSVPCATLGSATGVGVLDQGALIHYEMEATPFDANNNCGTAWAVVAGSGVDYPATSTVGNGVAPDSCVRLKTSFGKTPVTAFIASPVSPANRTANANNAEQGKLGDLGYSVASAGRTIGGSLVSERANLRAVSRVKNNLHVVFDTDTEVNINGFDVVGIDGKGGRKVIGNVACKQCTSGLSASYDTLVSDAKLQGAKQIQIVIQPSGVRSNTLPVK